VADSNVEAKFRVIGPSICKLIWLAQLMEDLQLPLTIPTKLFSDSKLFISIVNNKLPSSSNARFMEHGRGLGTLLFPGCRTWGQALSVHHFKSWYALVRPSGMPINI